MEDKIIEQKWEDGQLFDISEALDRARDIVKTADDIKAENGTLSDNTIVNVDEFDD